MDRRKQNSSTPGLTKKTNKMTIDAGMKILSRENSVVDTEDEGLLSDTASSTATPPPPPTTQQPQRRRRLQRQSIFDPALKDRLLLLGCITGWYLVGVGAIVTTKILLTDWKVPPLLLTFQQLLAASSIFRLFLSLFPGSGVQPLPWETVTSSSSDSEEQHSKMSSWKHIWEQHSDFLLAGLFNGLDFMSSNAAFSRSAASFVETIKSSDPITTTAVALAWNVDRLAGAESMGLFLLIVGVLLSTYGNAQSQHTASSSSMEDHSLAESVEGTMIVIIANLCFAFRAMFQKRYQSLAAADKQQPQLDDTNLLCRMQQTGALALLVPVVLTQTGLVVRCLATVPRNVQLYYVGLSGVNALCYAVYK